MAISKATSMPGGILKLTKLLEHLNKPPKLSLASNLKSLRLTLAYQNDHWGARHFVQEELPRIRYANPDVEIEVLKWRKEVNDLWRPELEMKFDDGDIKVVDMDQKWSTSILKEVMNIAGGDPWKAHVEEANRTGMPVFPGEAVYDQTAKREEKSNKKVPNLREFLKANPHKAQKVEQERKERLEKIRKNREDGQDVRKQETIVPGRVETQTEAQPSTSPLQPTSTTPTAS